MGVTALSGAVSRGRRRGHLGPLHAGTQSAWTSRCCLRPGDRAADAGASPAVGAACQLWGSGTRLARTVIGCPHTRPFREDTGTCSAFPPSLKTRGNRLGGQLPNPACFLPATPSPGNLLSSGTLERPGHPSAPPLPKARRPAEGALGSHHGHRAQSAHRTVTEIPVARWQELRGQDAAWSEPVLPWAAAVAEYMGQRPGGLKIVPARPPKGQSLPSQDGSICICETGRSCGVARRPCGNTTAWPSPKAGGAAVPRCRLTSAPRHPGGLPRGLCVFPGGGGGIGLQAIHPPLRRWEEKGPLVPGWACKPGRLFGAQLSGTSQRNSALHRGLHRTPRGQAPGPHVH